VRHDQSIVEDDEADVVKIPFKNYLFGQWIRATDLWPAYHPRLFRLDSMTLTGDVHDYENIHDDAEVLKLPLDPKRAIVHFNYTDIGDYIERKFIYHDRSRAEDR